MRSLFLESLILAIALAGLLGSPEAHGQSLKVSKANGYAVVAPKQASESVTKANGYAVVMPVQGSVSVTKANGYAVVAPVQGSMSVTKAVAYAVIAPAANVNQPSVFIFTKNSCPLTIGPPILTCMGREVELQSIERLVPRRKLYCANNFALK